MACEHELVAAFGGTLDRRRRPLDHRLRPARRGRRAARPRRRRPRAGRRSSSACSTASSPGSASACRGGPGARRLLAELNAQGVPCALVTMSWRRLVDAVVEALAPITFQAVVTGDEVEHGKPHPEPYLLAAAAPRRRPGAVRGDRGLPDRRRRRPAPPAASSSPCPTSSPIDPAPGRVIVPTPEGRRRPATSARWSPPRPPPAAPSAPPATRRRARRTVGRRRRPASSLAAIVAAIALRRRRSVAATTPRRRRRPGALDVHAWTPYWALEDALPELEARADTLAPALAVLVPGDRRRHDRGRAEHAGRRRPSSSSTPARDRGVPLVASILDGTEAGVMAGDPRRPRRSGPATSTPSPTSPPTATSTASTSTTSSSPSPTAATRGRRRGRTGSPSSSELADRLHADGRTLTVSIPPVYDAGQTDDSGYWVYDYAAITPLVDAIRVMAYDYSVRIRRRRSDRPAAVGRAGHRRHDARRPATRPSSSSASRCTATTGRSRTTGTCPATAEGVTSVDQPRRSTSWPPRRGATPAFDPATYEWSFTYDLDVDDGTTSCTQHAPGPLRRRRRRPAAHAARRRRRLRRRRPVRPRLRGRRGVDAVDTIAAQLATAVDQPPTPCRMTPMKVHLVDGTYELFRQHFGRAAREPDAGPYAATTGVLASTLQLLADGATHVGVASDHVIESFRNDLWPGYKTSAGMPPELLAQIPMVEEALVAMGVTTWAMVEHEADDALGAAAAVADADERVEQVLIVTPDKDLGQCVRGTRVVQFDRRKRELHRRGRRRSPSSACRRRRSPTTSGSSATPPTASPASPAGAPRARRPCSPATATSRTSPTAPGSGTSPGCAARPSCRSPCAQDFAAGPAVPPHRHRRDRRRRRHRRRLGVDRADARVRRLGASPSASPASPSAPHAGPSRGSRWPVRRLARSRPRSRRSVRIEATARRSAAHGWCR